MEQRSSFGEGGKYHLSADTKASRIIIYLFNTPFNVFVLFSIVIALAEIMYKKKNVKPTLSTHQGDEIRCFCEYPMTIPAYILFS